MAHNFLRRFSSSRSHHILRPRTSLRLHVEAMEARLVPTQLDVVSAAAAGAAPFVHLAAASPAGSVQPVGFGPSQVRHAYGFDQISFGTGIQGDGTGQTIAIVDAYDQPNIASDLAAFDAMYGLAAPPRFSKVNQTGGSVYPAANQSWGLEISLDVEWAHAIAPGANILLVEANSNAWSDLFAAVNYARNQSGVSVVSMSFGATEWSSEASYDGYFTTPAGHGGITFVASSGDSGSAGAPEYISVSPNVLAVGGTALSTDISGNYASETGWSGSGGGISAYEAQPSYQKGVVTQTSTRRAVPDVAYNGASSTPFAVYDTSLEPGWLAVYGTSAGAPQWAALVAIADQGLALSGKASLDGATQTLPALYQMAAGSFHDISTGSNGAYSAAAGYDLVTGRGSPLANLVVASLAGSNSGSTGGNQAPVVITPASATPSPVTGTTTTLTVQASDDGGASNLTYTWGIASAPTGATPPTFSINGSTSAQSTTATFYQAGSYTFQVTITDQGGLTATSSVSVIVNQTLAAIAVTPGTASVLGGGSQQFTATATDQFGKAMTTQPSWTWTIGSGGLGLISNSGLYTAPTSGNGIDTVQATAGGFTGSATVTFGSAPVAPTNLIASAASSRQVNLTWQSSASNVTGFIIQRSTNGGSWTQIANVGSTTASFTDTTVNKRKTYYYRIYAYNNFGTSPFSNVATVVTPAVGMALASTSVLTSSPPTDSGLDSEPSLASATSIIDAIMETLGQPAHGAGAILGWLDEPTWF